jgi:acetylornithine deacetylase/succinyl-diaminopimelate desuccinylase-like protein
MRVYARGAADDKGQTLVPHRVAARVAGARRAAGEHHHARRRRGGNRLAEPQAVRAESTAMRSKCDVAVVSDTNQFARGVPAITYGLRGLVYFDVVKLTSAKTISTPACSAGRRQPADELCKLLGSLHDADGRVTVEGFYDDVVRSRRRSARSGRSSRGMTSATSASSACPGRTARRAIPTLRAKWARPTLDVNGLNSGYQGRAPRRAAVRSVREGVHAPRAQPGPREDHRRLRANAAVAPARLMCD